MEKRSGGALQRKAAQSEKLAQKVVALTKDLQSHDAEKARLLDALAAEKRKAQEERGEKEARLAKVTEQLGVLQGTVAADRDELKALQQNSAAQQKQLAERFAAEKAELERDRAEKDRYAAELQSHMHALEGELRSKDAALAKSRAEAAEKMQAFQAAE